MASNLLLPLGNHRQYPAMDNERDIISIDQGGEWGKRCCLERFVGAANARLVA